MRRQLDALARARRPSRSGTSITSSPTSITGPVSPERSAQHGTQSCEQLVDAERLRDVVVRAGVERGDLLALLPDRGEDDHRRVAPGPELAAHVGAAAVGQHEVEDHRRGRMCRRRASAVAAVSAVSTVVTRAAQRRRAAHAGSAARRRRRGFAGSAPAPAKPTPPLLGRLRRAYGSCRKLRRYLHDRERKRKVAPWPGRDSTQTRPPFASTKPRAIARPSPAPARCARAGDRTARRRARAPRAVRPAPGRRPHDRLLARSRDPHVHVAVAGENLSAFSIRFASTRWICTASTFDQRRSHHPQLDPLGAGRSSTACADEIVERPDRRSRARRRRPRAATGRAGRRRAGSSRSASTAIVSRSSRRSGR